MPTERFHSGNAEILVGKDEGVAVFQAGRHCDVRLTAKEFEAVSYANNPCDDMRRRVVREE